MVRSTIWRCLPILGVVVIGAAFWRSMSSTAQAQGGGGVPPCCVGVLKLNDVLNRLDEKAVREAELKKFFEEKENAVNAVIDKVQALEGDIKLLPKDSPDRLAKREEYARLGAQAKIEAEISKALAANKKKQMELDMFNKIRAAASAVAKRQGLSLVLNDDSGIDIPEDAEPREVQAAMMTRKVMYASETVDISGEIANYMNNEFKAQGGKAGP